MQALLKHWPRIAVTLLPLLVALLHASEALQINVLQQLDNIIYDARLRATMPQSLDERIVIVDIDEKSLSELGRWPWSRNHLANLVNELFDAHKIAILGFDVVFAEADESSGLRRLQDLANGELRDQPGFTDRLKQIQSSLDYDAAFAKSLENRPAVMGYYLTSEREGRTNGFLPAPVMQKEALAGRPIEFYSFSGFGSNIEQLAKSAPSAGFFNSVTDRDGVVRSVPLIAEHKGQYYESLSLAMFRVLIDKPKVSPGFPREKFIGRNYKGLESILLTQGDKSLGIAVDDKVAALVPFRGLGDTAGGSFKYISAADLVFKRIKPGALQGKIVLLGATAAGLLDLRVTPVGATYPGVEVHANMISGLLDGRVLVKPDYAMGFEITVLVFSGLLLALALPLLTAPKAVALSLLVVGSLVGLNFWMYLGYNLVLPLACSLVMAFTAFALNMSFGYFVESKSKRQIANMFAAYVPPELVDEMVKDPDSYSMQAVNKELTVMFCDMRGFTNLSEKMEPTALQALLNNLFSRLTEIIQANRGTTDKYMGDCVMAFWGAPVDTPNHAHLAIKASIEMCEAVRKINAEHRDKGIPEIGVGIGLNTGIMCVGNMGSDIRRSYTVIGDAVNLGSRLEGLSKNYGVEIVVSETTKKIGHEFGWQELDKVRVKGKEQAVSIFMPLGLAAELPKNQQEELKTWSLLLKAYRNQDWEQCDVQLLNLQRLNAKKYLYQMYSERVASMRLLPFDPSWDGATNFETK
jgi:adenylate cyclase